MKCKHCGNEVSDDATFCTVCGTPVEREPALERPAEEPAPAAQPASAAEPERTDLEKFFANPHTIVQLILSGISFVAGIILFSINLAAAVPAGLGIDFLVLLPALVSLVLGVYNLDRARKAKDKLQLILAVVGICLSAFVLLFAFISCCVFNAKYLI